MFFPSSNSFSKTSKQNCFPRGFGYGGSGRGDEGDGYFGGGVDQRVSGGNLQQYNQQFHHSGVVGQAQLSNTRGEFVFCLIKL